MSERMVMRLSADPDAPVAWTPAARPEAVSHGSLAQAAGIIEGPLTVLVPGTDVVITQASIPARNRRQLRQALPYALEDRLAEDVEALHFASTPLDQTTLAAAVVARATLDAWLERLSDAGLRPQRLVPEPLALPWEPGTWHVLVGPERFALRIGPLAALAGDTENLGVMLELALAGAGEARPERLVVHSEQGAPAPAPIQGLAVEVETLAEPLAVLAPGADGGIDLLQGPYSHRERRGQLWRPWRAAAVLAGAWLGLAAAGDGLATWRLAHRAEALQAQVEQRFREALPDVQRMVDPRVQMQRRLETLRSGTDQRGFLALLERTGQVLAEAQGTRLEALHYRDGALTLDLATESLQSLDRLKRRLTQGGSLAVEIRTASAEADRVRGRLIVRDERS